jgi:hypothetical protein
LYLAASSLVDDAPASKISKKMQTESDGTHDQQHQNGIIYSSSSW